ncbi:MAG: glycosyltransferase family 39 protein, partial [Chloroflexota bacterium]|nr:glycosyltransferase family 39 protein [Chloroflexota bacterium]
MLAALLGAFSLRVYGLGGGSLWNDEGYTVVGPAYRGWDIPTAIPVGPFSLYYRLVHLWMNAAGGSELSLRFPSVLAGTAAIAVGFVIGRSLGGSLAGLAAAALLTIAPPLVGDARTARPYALVLLLLAVNAYALLRLAMTPRRTRWWVVAAGSLLAASYCHLFALVALPANLLVAGSAAARDRTLLRRFALSLAAFTAALFPWALGSFGQTYARVATRAASSAPSPLAFLGDVRDGLAVGDGITLDQAAAGLLAVGLLVGFSSGIAVLWRRRSLTALVLPAYVALALAASYAVVSRVPYFSGRYVTFLAPPVLAVLAMAVGSRKRWATGLALVASGCLVAAWAPQLGEQLAAPPEQLGQLAEELRARAQPADVLLSNSTWRQMDLDYYLRGVPLPAFALDVPATDATVDAAAERQARQDANRAPRVWLALFGLSGPPPDGFIRAILGEGYTQVSRNLYGTTQLALYQLQPAQGTVTLPSDVLFGSALELVSHGGMPATALHPGEGLVVPMDWRIEQPGDYVLSLRLVDDTGDVWAQNDSPLTGTQAADSVAIGMSVPLGTPPGAYHVVVHAVEQPTGQELPVATPSSRFGPVSLELGNVKVDRAVAPAPIDLLPLQRRLNEAAGSAKLLGGSWPKAASTGEYLRFGLTWQAALALKGNEVLRVRLVAARGGKAAEADLPLDFARSPWLKNEVRQERYAIRIPALAQAGTYRLEASILDAATGGGAAARQELYITSIAVTSRPRTFSTRPMEWGYHAAFGPMTLLGAGVQGARSKGPKAVELKAGSRVEVDLLWQAAGNLPPSGIGASYKVLVQLLDQGGRLVSQHD